MIFVMRSPPIAAHTDRKRRIGPAAKIMRDAPDRPLCRLLRDGPRALNDVGSSVPERRFGAARWHACASRPARR